ncbi:hypothetical protein [uncultured Hyphomicrobium sp.]|uniref:hypothetical protein n=1 Tax=uncultured Hyphomicrobium sp. TaxID=194373 RepID=UPI0025F8C960|nr:hypothetical protein [uncultured Hyphomicrobium sp.]
MTLTIDRPRPGTRKQTTYVGFHHRIVEIYTRFGHTAHFVYDNREDDEIANDGTGLPPVHGPFNSDRRAREYIALRDFGRA